MLVLSEDRKDQPDHKALKEHQGQLAIQVRQEHRDQQVQLEQPEHKAPQEQ